MITTQDKIEKLYRFPCGAADISADGVCRRSLKDHLDFLLDKLTEEVNPEPPKSKVPKGAEVSEDGTHFIIESFEEIPNKKDLQGNSKLLQDASGKMTGWRGQ